ncbi:chromosome segregation protein SMC [Verrucomicrobiota bacterium]
MYLKQVELIGFKSFAEKTRLNFEPGMTAIVGPNGCGKSNVSDAIRWVLGETRVKAIRGASMADMIFNGADTHKALNMAEVSLTLADCAEKLGVEYNEVCITRRVFRTGESAYFLNKKPCRLKDIHRLFMDTGIGTNSYSIMEQGKIDQILSSKPQDRRDVFEEASGITKYKADKKEAMRKLEQTEANLLRLEDVIREVKRQIISLQRQAAKARRYKSLQEEVRGLDIYFTRIQLKLMSEQLGLLENAMQQLNTEIAALQQLVETEETRAQDIRTQLGSIDQSIAAAMDASLKAQSELDRARQMIKINHDRVEELKSLAVRNTRETEEARRRFEEHRYSLEEISQRMLLADEERLRSAEELATVTEHQKEAEQEFHTGRELLNQLRNQSMALESDATHTRNELNALDAKQRESVLRRERLAAEKGELARTVESFMQRQEEMVHRVKELRGLVAGKTELINQLLGEQSTRDERATAMEREIFEMQKEVAAKRAQFEMLSSDEARQEDFPPGARALLGAEDETLDTSAVIGPLAEQLTADDTYQSALEAVIRPWMDAVVVESQNAARNLIAVINEQELGSVRLLSIAGHPATAAVSSSIGSPLINHIKCDEKIRPLAERLLHNVYVTETVIELPPEVPAGAIFVARNGAVFSGQGAAELWQPEAGETTPLSRFHLREQLQQELDQLESQIQAKSEELEILRAAKEQLRDNIALARREMDESKHHLSVQEGENQVITRETLQARERLETVSFELQTLQDATDEEVQAREILAQKVEETQMRQIEVRNRISLQTETMNEVEARRSTVMAEVSERRIAHVQKNQQVETLAQQKAQLESRLSELEALINDRTTGVETYTQRIDELQSCITTQQENLSALQIQVDDSTRHLAVEKARREEHMALLMQIEDTLRGVRRELEAKQAQKSQQNVSQAQQQIHFENAITRITSTYNITLEQVEEEPEPEWPDGEVPPREELEQRVTEIHAKLESMGPVNLVAIEEHAEHEERYAFLTQQQSDLSAAKEQLLDLIRKINATTTEMFTDTFNKVNENFQMMFGKIFGGGTAKLVMVDEEDVLESGIDIIARPPGKKNQSISLLSGGERTMTAVALLFSLFMVKPSPFCVLDEIDAALDEANIGRFVTTVQGFLENTQFVIITHSNRTISAADTIYGVTMPRKGVSSVISMKFADYEQNKELQQ